MATAGGRTYPRVIRVAVAALLAITAALGLPTAATALGWSPVVACSNGGVVSGQSYRSSFSNAGGWTGADYGCGPRVSIHLRYEIYPGGPIYNTTKKYSNYYVSTTQSGTLAGYHIAYTSSGAGVGIAYS